MKIENYTGVIRKLKLHNLGVSISEYDNHIITYFNEVFSNLDIKTINSGLDTNIKEYIYNGDVIFQHGDNNLIITQNYLVLLRSLFNITEIIAFNLVRDYVQYYFNYNGTGTIVGIIPREYEQ